MPAPVKRPVHGILLIDKPSGYSSNAVLQRVKRLYHAKKAGHTGSLDPLATGMLPIYFGHAAKLSQYGLTAAKRYCVDVEFGVATDTGDKEGQPIEHAAVPELTVLQMQEQLQTHLGEQDQVPPMYSALKHQGQPLYKLARQGKVVERQARRIVIHEIHLIVWDAPVLRFEVACSKGTYVRTLAEDIAKSLGSVAHLSGLRRLSVGDYREDQMVSLVELETAAELDLDKLDQKLLPLTAALTHLPSINLDSDIIRCLQQGKLPVVPAIQASIEAGDYLPNTEIVLLDSCGGYMGIGSCQLDGRIKPLRMLPMMEASE